MSSSFTEGRVLARNSLLNLVGQGAPLVVALVALPVLAEALGLDRFGLLLIAWAVLGYFGLFDLGMGRALTQLMAEKMGRGREAELPALVWTALLLMMGLGVLGGLVLAGLTPWLVEDVLRNTPEPMRPEARAALYVLAGSIPLVITTAGLRGVLEARQWFGVLNAIRVPMGLFIYAGPLVVLPFSQSLTAVVAVLVAGRLLAWVAHGWACYRALPALGRGLRFDRGLIPTLFRFGGWMTVSNVLGPLMVYVDRFVIGAVLTLSAVSYYTTPWELVTKLSIVPAAIAAVLFPTFGFWYGRDLNRTAGLYYTGLKAVTLGLFPLVLLVVVFARPGLDWLLGEDFAANGTRVLQILGIGVLVNGVASLPFALLQGLRRPDLTAKLHLAELPVYGVALYVLIRAYGINGVAVAWLLRVALDCVLLLGLADRFLPARTLHYKRFLGLTGLLLGVLGLAMLPVGRGLLIPFLLIATGVLFRLAWVYAATEEERVFLRSTLAGYGVWGWNRPS